MIIDIKSKKSEDKELSNLLENSNINSNFEIVDGKNNKIGYICNNLCSDRLNGEKINCIINNGGKRIGLISNFEIYGLNNKKINCYIKNNKIIKYTNCSIINETN